MGLALVSRAEKRSFAPIDNESPAKAWFLMVLLIFVAARWAGSAAAAAYRGGK
jgi:hypothetical protein